MNPKYFILAFVSVIACSVDAQTSPNNQAIVTIIGDPVQANAAGNPYADNTAPPEKQKISPPDQKNIEPTLENGFHMRFEAEDSYIPHGGTTSYPATASVGSSSGGSSSYGKTRKHGASMAERSFNVKKRVKSWLPKFKKKYRPHLCSRF